MSKVIGIEREPKPKYILKILKSPCSPTLHKLNGVPGNDDFYIKYNKTGYTEASDIFCVRSQLSLVRNTEEF